MGAQGCRGLVGGAGGLGVGGCGCRVSPAPQAAQRTFPQALRALLRVLSVLRRSLPEGVRSPAVSPNGAPLPALPGKTEPPNAWLVLWALARGGAGRGSEPGLW